MYPCRVGGYELSCCRVCCRRRRVGLTAGMRLGTSENMPDIVGRRVLIVTLGTRGDVQPFLVLAHALKRAGASEIRECLVLPVATGMTVTLTLLALRRMRPQAKYVVWPRIDQKSCLKAVSAAGCTPLVVENVFEGDELRTDVESIKSAHPRPYRVPALGGATFRVCPG